LQMWVGIKSSDPADAWCLLVDAQEYANMALRIPVQGAWGISEYQQHLLKIEDTIFPGWPVYNSPAFIEETGDCSICFRPYSECEDHIEDLIYCGRLCERINRKMIRANHIAIVKFPKDRRCIIRHISNDDGRKKDYITGKVLDEKFEKYSDDEGLMIFSGIIMTSKRLDFD
jgi:hypothetical protein